MINIYKNRWINEYGKEPDLTWSTELEKINTARIKLGVDRCLGSGVDFVPSLPKFIGMTKVKPVDINAPDLESAYIEACNGGRDVLQICTKTNLKTTVGKDWGHLAVYHARKECPNFAYINNEKSKKEIFERHYNDVCERIFNGEQLDMPETILYISNNPSGVITKSNKDTAKNTLAQLKEGFK